MSHPITPKTVAGADAAAGASRSSQRFPETADIETASEGYAARFAGPIGQWLLQVQAQATQTLLAPYPQATVLDVGGGHAQLTPMLVEAGHAVTVLGSDEVCQQRLRPWLARGQCQFQVGNVLALPYPDNAFDVVISYRFLAHVQDWQTFLSELARVARRAILIDYPTVRSVNAIAPLLFQMKKGIESNTRPFICYQERQILDYLTTLGVHPSDRYAQFFWPMVLHRLLKSPQASAILEGIVRPWGLTTLLGSPVILRADKTGVGE